MRKLKEIHDAAEEYFQKSWFIRNTRLVIDDEGNEKILARHSVGEPMIQKLLEQYGEENLMPEDDFEVGMINGKLSALRWVLGDDWDDLDT